MNLLRQISETVDAVSELTGRLVAWLTLAMVLVMFGIVVLRYAFDTGWIALQESVTYLHAIVFMFGASYTLRHDEHVRVDVFYQRWPPAKRALVNLAGTVLLLLPLATFIFWISLDYVIQAWRVTEGSRQTGGLPFTYLLKTVIPVTAMLLVLQGLAEVARSIMQLRGGSLREESPSHKEHL